jgi:chromosomal replication initiator protein
MTDRVVPTRFPGLSPQHIEQCRALSERVADLASTFPLLFFMLARKCGPLRQRHEAARLAESGNPLGDVAGAYGLPLCLRRIPAAACHTPPPWVRWSAGTGRLLADHIPSQPLQAANWLAATFFAARACHEAFGLWIAKQDTIFGEEKFEVGLLLPLALYAWHSCEPASPLNRLAVKPWTPKFGIKSAMAEADHWLTRLRLLVYCGDYPISDTWLHGGCVAGFDFVPLTTLDGIMAERVAMRNCLHTYLDKLASGACRLFAVKSRNRSVATLEIGADRRGGLRITQLKGPGNAKPAPDVQAAVQAWFRGQPKRRPGDSSPSPDTAAATLGRLLAPYHYAAASDGDRHEAASFAALHKQMELLKRHVAALERLGRTRNAPQVRPAMSAPQATAIRLGDRVRRALQTRLGEDIYSSWFSSLEFHGFEGGVVLASVPVRSVKRWIQAHYAEDLLRCCAAEFAGIERVDLVLLEPGAGMAHDPEPRRLAVIGRTGVTGEGSPLNPRHVFDNFVVGPSNRLANAAAIQLAETVPANAPTFNPLYLHAPVGLGKTHLQHAMAWEIKRRHPGAGVLYVTAERFRYSFAEALRSQDVMPFADGFRPIDIMLIDDLEFMRGERTEQELERIIDVLLDGGRQVVVASACRPAELRAFSERTRARLQHGLVVDLHRMDPVLRRRVLERRIGEKRAADPSFEVPNDVTALLADHLEETGHELEGAVNRLFLGWQAMRTPITLDVAREIVGDLAHGCGPRRTRIEDVLRIVSQHYRVSKADILSQRPHRSLVRPRQVAMYLARHLACRGVPEIGRRFGRDATDVARAVRKIDNAISDNPILRHEIGELRRLLSA